MEGLGQFFACPLFGERQVRRHATQLNRPPFEFDRPLLERRVALEQRRIDQFAVGDVDSRAGVTNERTVASVSRHTLGHGPAILAVVATKAVLHQKRLALIEGGLIHVPAPLDIVGINESDPAVTRHLVRRPAGEVEPGLIHVRDLLADIRHPDHHRRRVGDAAEAVLAFARGLPSLEQRLHRLMASQGVPENLADGSELVHQLRCPRVVATVRQERDRAGYLAAHLEWNRCHGPYAAVTKVFLLGRRLFG